MCRSCRRRSNSNPFISSSPGWSNGKKLFRRFDDNLFVEQTHVDNLPRARRRHEERTRTDALAASRALLAEFEARQATTKDADELPAVYEDCAPRAFLSL